MSSFVLAAIFLVLAIGCNSADNSRNAALGAIAGAGAGDPNARTEGTIGSVWKNRDAAELFNIDHVPEFEFTLPEADWQRLRDNASKEQYVPAEATYEGKPAGTIGLRFKGNYGSLYSCFDRTTGALICSKLSFKVNFGKYDSHNRFFRQKSLNFHSMVRDPSKLHERLAYELFQLSDIKTPRSTWANVKVNGESYGLFSLVEEIDGRFVADRWPTDGLGNLYKEAWPESSDEAYYSDKLETNDDAPNHDKILAFASDLTQGSVDGSARALGNWTDLQQLYRYMAVHDTIVNCDGITALYCVAGTGPVWGNHNYFFYQQQSQDLFWLIPWDMTRALTTCPAFAAVPHWSGQPADCDQNYQVWDGGWVKAPGCDRFFQALALDLPSYRQAMDAFLAGPFETESLLSRINAWADLIRSSVIADPTADGEASWDSEVEKMRQLIPILRERAVKLRDGLPLSPMTLSLSDANGFESATPVEALLGLQLEASAHTDIAHHLSTVGAMSGSQELRLDFTYRDPTQESGVGGRQWIRYMLPLAGGFNDLSSIAHVQMLLKTDQTRTVRVELESDRQSGATKRIKFGWDVEVTSEGRAVDLWLDEATPPSSASGIADVLSDVRQHVNGIAFNPYPVGLDASGYLGPGNADSGYLQVDDIVFLPQ